MTCGLSGNALVPSEPLYTELVCKICQPPPFPHWARAERPYVIWSIPGGRAEHESAELFLQTSLQSKVVSVVEEKCSEAREGGSANSAAKERPFDLVCHPLVPPHSVELSPSAICSPYPLVNVSAHREHGRMHNAQKAVGSLHLVLLIFDRPPEIGQYHKFSSIWSKTRKSPALNSPRPFSLPPYVHIRPLRPSPANSTPQERSTSSYGLRPWMSRFVLVTEACHVSIAP